MRIDICRDFSYLVLFGPMALAAAGCTFLAPDESEFSAGGEAGSSPSQTGSSTGEAQPMTGGATSGGSGGGGAVSGVGGTTGSLPAWGEVTGAPRSNCQEIPLLLEPPTIDGTIEIGVYLEEVEPQGWREETPIPAGNRSWFGAAWRHDGVYVFFVVEDPDRFPSDRPLDVTTETKIWQGDSIEFYIDHDGIFDATIGTYPPTGTRHFLLAAPPSDVEDNTDRGTIRRANDGMNEFWYYDPVRWVSKPYEGGYYVEAFVSAAELGLDSWILEEGDLIGFNFAHNVSGETTGEGYRLSQYFVQVRDPLEGNQHDYPFANETTFCTPRLSAP